MAQFKYVGEGQRYYPDQGLEVEPGDVAEWDNAPDFRWEPVDPTDPTVTPPEGGVVSVRADTGDDVISADDPASTEVDEQPVQE